MVICRILRWDTDDLILLLRAIRMCGVGEEWNRQGYALQHRKSAGDRMLVKRPLLITEDKVLTGFKEADWEKAF